MTDDRNEESQKYLILLLTGMWSQRMIFNQSLLHHFRRKFFCNEEEKI